MPALPEAPLYAPENFPNEVHLIANKRGFSHVLVETYPPIHAVSFFRTVLHCVFARAGAGASHSSAGSGLSSHAGGGAVHRAIHRGKSGESATDCRRVSGQRSRRLLAGRWPQLATGRKRGSQELSRLWR